MIGLGLFNTVVAKTVGAIVGRGQAGFLFEFAGHAAFAGSGRTIDRDDFVRGHGVRRKSRRNANLPPGVRGRVS